jgi:NAD(P)-dependent dehydrogenase (short-subunit alcohol dehydrogenase family)
MVITGVSRGIGRGILEHAANSSECDMVIGIVKPGSHHMNELKQKFGDKSKVKLMEADVGDFDSLKQCVDKLKQDNCVPSLVIANAGVMTKLKPIWQVTKEEMDDAYRVDVRGTFNTMKAFIPLMKDKKGAVIANISSDWGLCGNKGCATFCMAKFAIEGLTKTAALDVEDSQLTIVAISPGMVMTDLLVEAYGQEQAKKIGTPCEEFIPKFHEKINSIEKHQSGQHLDFSVKRATRAG